MRRAISTAFGVIAIVAVAGCGATAQTLDSYVHGTWNCSTDVHGDTELVVVTVGDGTWSVAEKPDQGGTWGGTWKLDASGLTVVGANGIDFHTSGLPATVKNPSSILGLAWADGSVDVKSAGKDVTVAFRSDDDLTTTTCFK